MQYRKSILCVLVALAALAALSVEASEPSGVVNINTASAEELQLLPRVGPSLAGRIIEFRQTNGPFRTVDEILAVKGIGDSSFEKLAPYIVTSGATTLAEKVRLARSTGGGQTAD
jgi:competence protein ComEA